MSNPLIKGAVLLAILSPIVFAFLFVYRFGVNVPYNDQWAVVSLFPELRNGTLGVVDLLRLHNEHRIFFPRIIMLTLGTITAYNVIFEMYFIQICAVLSAVVLWFAFRRGSRYQLLLFIPVVLLLFSLRQYQNMLWGIQMVVVMTQAFAILAFYCLYISKHRNFRKFAFPGAVVSATVATLTFAQGLFVWPIGLLQLLITSLDGRSKKLLAGAWGFIGLVQWIAYFLDFSRPGDHPGSDHVLSNPLDGVEYFLILMGSALFWEQGVALIGGLVLAGFVLAAFLLLYQNRGELGEYSFWISLLLFGLAFLFVTMISRVGFGVEQAVASRYVGFSILPIIAIYGIFVKLALEKRTIAAIGCSIALAAVVLFSIPGSYQKGLQAGNSTMNNREQAAFILENYESQPDELLTLLRRTNTDRVKRDAPILEDLNYSVFAEARDSVPPLSELALASPSDTLFNLGTIDGKRISDAEQPIPVSKEDGLVRVNGWAVDAEAEDVAGGVYISVGGERYPIRYGIDRRNVAAQYNVPAYAESGFEGYIAVSELEPGTHEVSFFVLTNDREAYYRTPPVLIEVR
jgi:hypothetical protein